MVEPDHSKPLEGEIKREEKAPERRVLSRSREELHSGSESLVME
jgi:hypothetical protein